MDEVCTWASYRAGLFGDPYLVWHDGADFTRLLELARTDPDEIARMLPLGIRAGDPVAAQSVAVLADAGLAPAGISATVTAALPGAGGSFRVYLACALRVLTGDQAWAGEIVPVLARAPFWSDRVDAAIMLREFAPTPVLVEALARAVTDEEYLVRRHASDTLLRWAGDEGWAGEEGWDRRVASDDRAVWREAAQDLTGRVLRRR